MVLLASSGAPSDKEPSYHLKVLLHSNSILLGSKHLAPGTSRDI